MSNKLFSFFRVTTVLSIRSPKGLTRMWKNLEKTWNVSARFVRNLSQVQFEKFYFRKHWLPAQKAFKQIELSKLIHSPLEWFPRFLCPWSLWCCNHDSLLDKLEKTKCVNHNDSRHYHWTPWKDLKGDTEKNRKKFPTRFGSGCCLTKSDGWTINRPVLFLQPKSPLFLYFCHSFGKNKERLCRHLIFCGYIQSACRPTKYSLSLLLGEELGSVQKLECNIVSNWKSKMIFDFLHRNNLIEYENCFEWIVFLLFIFSSFYQLSICIFLQEFNRKRYQFELGFHKFIEPAISFFFRRIRKIFVV